MGRGDWLVDEPPSAAALRSQMTAWRRRRTPLALREVLEDAYVGILAVVMLGAMLGNALWGLRAMGAEACDADCGVLRTGLSWLAVPVWALTTAAAARLLGPVFVPPAAGAWLLASPVSRADLLRAPLARALLIAPAASAVALAPVALLGGADIAVATLQWACGVALSTALVAHTALDQVRSGRSGRWPAIATATGAALGLLALALLPRLDGGAGVGLSAAYRDALAALPPAAGTALLAALLLLLLAWCLATARSALRSLPDTRRRALADAEGAWPSLSGAMAALDLALVHDVVVSRRWRAVGWLTPRRGGPRGWFTLPWAECRRLQRSPAAPLALLATLPLGAAATGPLGPRGAAALVAVVGFVLGARLLGGLRVVSRTRTAARALPFSDAALRAGVLLVPGGLVLAWAGLSLAPAALAAPAQGWWLAAGAGASAVAAATHWVAAAPPDHGRPMLMTPAGGLPPGLVTALTRGLNVSLLTSLLLLVPGWGVWASLALSAAVVAYHLTASSTV